MSTPRTIAAYCKHGNSYCILCFAESKEGVAAPLEPTLTPEKFIKQWDSFAIPDRHDAYWMEFAEAYAAAVSKNLREELANAKRMLYELTPEDIRGMAYDANALLEARVAELEKEITALREKP